MEWIGECISNGITHRPVWLPDFKIASSSCVKDDCSLIFVYEDGPIKSSAIKIDGAEVEVEHDIAGKRLVAHASSQPAGRNRHAYEINAVDYTGAKMHLEGVVQEEEPVTRLEICTDTMQVALFRITD